jgi:superfamily II DNA or RNA helicase
MWSGQLLPPGVYTKDISPEELKKLTKKYTIEHTNILGHVEKFTSVYRTNTGWYVIPRDILHENRNIERKISEGLDISCEYTGTLLPWQESLVSTILQKTKTGVTLQLEPGKGKTFIACDIIHKIRKQTIICVPSIPLLRQWETILHQLFPNVPIGTFYAGGNKKMSPIVVCTIHTLIAEDHFTIEHAKNYGLLIVDESHEYVSTKRNRALRNFRCNHILALTGTPYDSTKKIDALSHWILGRVFNGNRFVEDAPAIRLTGKVLQIKYTANHPYNQIVYRDATGSRDYSASIGMICEDVPRMALILKHISRLLKDNRNVFVFADRIEYLEKIQKQVEGSHVVVGGTKDDRFDEIASTSKCILTTYQYLGTGKSIPRMDSIIFATPRKSHVAQFLGRIFRGNRNSHIVREVVDVVDMVHAKSQWYERKRVYDEKELKIEQIVVKSAGL